MELSKQEMELLPHSAQLGIQLVWILAGLASWATKWYYFLKGPTQPPNHPATRHLSFGSTVCWLLVLVSVPSRIFYNKFKDLLLA